MTPPRGPYGMEWYAECQCGQRRGPRKHKSDLLGDMRRHDRVCPKRSTEEQIANAVDAAFGTDSVIEFPDRWRLFQLPQREE